jgi:hypothetical protein
MLNCMIGFNQKTNVMFERDLFFSIDEQQNPYKPTYTFPEEFDGNLELMENYIRKAASQNTDEDDNSKNEKKKEMIEFKRMKYFI